MSYALADIRRLLATPTATPGAVVGTPSAGIVRVATPQGAALARTLSPLAIGTRVLIAGGIATPAPVARQSYPV